MKAELFSLESGDAGSVDLADDVFDVEVRPDILHRVVLWQLAKRQAGTHKAKTRGEVSYSKRKMVSQKRSGRARRGSRTTNILRHGGVWGGPQPRSHAHSLPKKVRRMALRMALSDKARSGNLTVIDSAALAEPRTRLLRGSPLAQGKGGTLLIGGSKVDANLVKAARNVERLNLLPCVGANVYDIMRHRRLVVVKDAIGELEARAR